MAKTDLTAQRLRELMQYDPETGIFVWRIKPNRNIRIGDVVGTSRGAGECLQTKIDGYFYRLHRLAWLYIHEAWPNADIDHVDGNPQNNAIANLRDVTRSVNLQNRRRAMGHNTTSGLLGVSKKRNRWRARIRAEGRDIVSYHDTAAEAQAAYLELKRAHHPGNML